VKLIVVHAAQTELEEARDFYLQHASPRIAAAFLDEFERSTRRLLEYPTFGTPISLKQRHLTLRHFPYSIIYRLSSEGIIITAIAHQRRRPGYWAGRGG
jgi:plasmid stabilization system protein ParE